MRTTLLSLAAAASVAASLSLSVGNVAAESMQVAQAGVDVRVGPPGTIEERRRPAEVIEERRPGVVIEGTEGRRRDCVTRSESQTRNGVTVTESERDCR